jgi:uncharacterized protein (TIGR02231 family)
METTVSTELTAPIVAVTVYPDRARVTRRGRLRLPVGEHRVVVDRLPLSLDVDSIRVAGHGPATVLGVDVGRRHEARTSDETVAALEDELRQARAELAALDDDDRVAEERMAFYARLARRSTRSYGDALAVGQTDPARAVDLVESLAARMTEVRAERRGLAERRARAGERVDACQRRLDARQREHRPDHMTATVALEIAPPAGVDLAGVDLAAGDLAEVELELSYVVDGAGWRSAYDLRLSADTLSLTWFGLVSQHTGEDWPECDLRLSTARPTSPTDVPELDPWFLDRWRPAPVALAKRSRLMDEGPGRAMPAPAYAPMAAVAGGAAPDEEKLAEIFATVEQGPVAATYTPARPVAVPADGGAHRAAVAVVELTAARDYVTAPVRADTVHLRATVVNTSAHTFPRGPAAVFHEGEFVGTTDLSTWAPGEETELALGVDGRIRVERKLVRRTATKAVLGATRRRDAEYRITVANHTGQPARLTILDQLPVSRDEGIVVKETRLDPVPGERTELGVLTWEFTLEPGETRQISLGLRVELARGVELVGWRE